MSDKTFPGWTSVPTGLTCRLCHQPMLRWAPGSTPLPLSAERESVWRGVDPEVVLPQSDDARLTERIPLPCACEDPTDSPYLDRNDDSTIAADAARCYSLVWEKRYKLLCDRLEAVPATRHYDAERTRPLPEKWAPHVSPATGQLISMRYQMNKQIGGEFHNRMHLARSALSGLKSRWTMLREKRAEARPDRKLLQRLEKAMAEQVARVKEVRDDPETEELREVLLSIGRQYIALPAYRNLVAFLRRNPLEPGRRKHERWGREMQANSDAMLRRIQEHNRRMDQMGQQTFGEIFGLGECWLPASEEMQEAFRGALSEGARGELEESAIGRAFEAGVGAVDGAVDGARERLAGAFAGVLGEERGGALAERVAEGLEGRARERMDAALEGIQEELLGRLAADPRGVGAAELLRLDAALAGSGRALRGRDASRACGDAAATPVAAALRLPPELENGVPPAGVPPKAAGGGGRGGGAFGLLLRNLKLA